MSEASDASKVTDNDRAAQQPANPDLSFARGGGGLRPVPDDSAPVEPAVQPARRRNLLSTFRAIPGDQASGGPGPDREPTSTSILDPAPAPRPAHHPFAPRPLDPRASGPTLQPAPERPDRPSAPAPCPDNPARRSAAVLAAGPTPAALGPTVAAASSPAGGRVRGRRAGSVAGGGAAGEKSTQAGADAPVLPREIAKLLPQDSGVRVDHADPASPANLARLVPTEAARADAHRLFREIGERFNLNRKKSKTAAYAAYRHDLMANLDTLIMGGAIDLKEVTTVITNLELLTKETETEATETPVMVLGRWLRIAPGEVAELEQGAAGMEEAEGDSLEGDNEEEVNLADSNE